jgi:hypothetical protein
MGEDEAGTAKAATPITFNAFMSIPAGRCAQVAAVRRGRGEWVKSTFAVIHFTVSSN